jgi:hypothetical protein
MIDFVWVSQAPSDPTLADGIMKSSLNVDGNKQLVELSNVARHGGVVRADQLPTEMWGEVGEYRAHHFPNRWPDISYFAGLWLISDKVAAILRSFDMGNGVIAPVKLFARDHVTLANGDWFVWKIGNMKAAFLPERSQHIRPVPGRSFRMLTAGDGDLACSTTANTGPDVWIDPKLRGVLFLGRKLGQALIAADLANERAGFGALIRCEVVEA